jgi:hypothetical protein
MITIHFVWYLGALGLLMTGTATVRLIRHTAHSARFDVAAAVLYVVAVLFIRLAVVRNVAFDVVFSIIFGTLTAFSNWLSLRNRSRLRG